MTAESFAWLILCIYFEARGQTFSEKVKVGHVVINRSIQKDKSIREVIQQPYQFSFYTELKKGRMKITEFDAYVECVQAAAQVEQEQDRGMNFYRANHYHDHSIDPPTWTRAMVVVGETEDFTFYRG